MPHLFSPFKIKSVELKNRIVTSPMCEYSAEDGFANDWHLVHLGTRAVGGAGLVITEAAAVSPEGRITHGDLGIWKDEHIGKLKQITDFITAQDCVAGIQLGHAGRKGSSEQPWIGGKQLASTHEHGWTTLAPTAQPFNEGTESPVELDLAGINKVITDFREAAVRAHKAGFKVIELHAAHGYLINEFMSPLSNHRTDEYGGSFENRIRLLVEITDAVMQVWPVDLPLFVRISVDEWTAGGWDTDDSVRLVKILKEKGVDLIDCSSGGNSSAQKIDVKPGYQVPFSIKVRAEAEIPTGAVGLITESCQANLIIEKGEADLVFLARELLRDPYFPLRAAHELNQTVKWPVQYERAHFRQVK